MPVIMHDDLLLALPHSHRLEIDNRLANICRWLREFAAVDMGWVPLERVHTVGPCILCRVPLVQYELAFQETLMDYGTGLVTGVPGTVRCFECVEQAYILENDDDQGLLDPLRFHGLED